MYGAFIYSALVLRTARFSLLLCAPLSEAWRRSAWRGAAPGGLAGRWAACARRRRAGRPGKTQLIQGMSWNTTLKKCRLDSVLRWKHKLNPQAPQPLASIRVLLRGALKTRRRQPGTTSVSTAATCGATFTTVSLLPTSGGSVRNAVPLVVCVLWLLAPADSRV